MLLLSQLWDDGIALCIMLISAFIFIQNKIVILCCYALCSVPSYYVNQVVSLTLYSCHGKSKTGVKVQRKITAVFYAKLSTLFNEICTLLMFSYTQASTFFIHHLPHVSINKLPIPPASWKRKKKLFKVSRAWKIYTTITSNAFIMYVRLFLYLKV